MSVVPTPAQGCGRPQTQTARARPRGSLPRCGQQHQGQPWPIRARGGPDGALAGDPPGGDRSQAGRLDYSGRLGPPALGKGALGGSSGFTLPHRPVRWSLLGEYSGVGRTPPPDRAVPSALLTPGGLSQPEGCMVGVLILGAGWGWYHRIEVGQQAAVGRNGVGPWGGPREGRRRREDGAHPTALALSFARKDPAQECQRWAGGPCSVYWAPQRPCATSLSPLPQHNLLKPTAAALFSHGFWGQGGTPCSAGAGRGRRVAREELRLCSEGRKLIQTAASQGLPCPPAPPPYQGTRLGVFPLLSHRSSCGHSGPPGPLGSSQTTAQSRDLGLFCPPSSPLTSGPKVPAVHSPPRARGKGV